LLPFEEAGLAAVLGRGRR